jgi:hypothetical protein
LFYSVQGRNDKKGAEELRRAVARYVRENYTHNIPGLEISIAQALHDRGLTMEGYTASVVRGDHWGGEPELVLLSRIKRMRLRVFRDNGDSWAEEHEYGFEGPVQRLLFTNGRHYDWIAVRERWE